MSARADPNAGEALALLMRGDIEHGLALYRDCLKLGPLPDAPVGLHLLFLEQAGQAETAARLLDLAVGQGANVAAKAGGFGADPGEAAAEYEALFARGIANSRMVYEYLRVLAELGRWEDLRRMLDLDRLLRVIRRDLPDPSGTGNLAQALEELLVELEPQAEQQDSVQSVRNMRMLKRFSSLGHPAAQALMGALSSEVRDYIGGWSSSDHPLANLVPQGFHLDAWGLVSRGEGFNAHHIHQKGWATGIYYPTTVEAGAGGELLIGRPDGAAGSDADWGTMRVRPEAGLLVLMPSYYSHWTVPLGRPGLRTSIAFDVLPAKDPC